MVGPRLTLVALRDATRDGDKRHLELVVSPLGRPVGVVSCAPEDLLLRRRSDFLIFKKGEKMQFVHEDGAYADILSWGEELATLRREAHKTPELGFDTPQTVGRIEKTLQRRRHRRDRRHASGKDRGSACRH